MDIEEIFEEAIGLKEDGTPKALVSIAHQIYDTDTNEILPQNEHAIHNAEIGINSLSPLTQIQLKFPSPADSNLKIAWNIIQTFQKQAFDALQKEENKFHTLVINIIPEKYEGKHFISAAIPLLVYLEADAPAGSVTTISALFNEDDVVFYETDDINMDEIDSEVDREIAEIERMEEFAERKKAEKEEFEQKRNLLLQKKRGF